MDTAFLETKEEIISSLQDKMEKYLDNMLKKDVFANILEQAVNKEITVNDAVTKIFHLL